VPHYKGKASQAPPRWAKINHVAKTQLEWAKPHPVGKVTRLARTGKQSKVPSK